MCLAVYCVEGHRGCFCGAAIAIHVMFLISVVRAEDASSVDKGRLEGLANGAGGVVELD